MTIQNFKGIVIVAGRLPKTIKVNVARQFMHPKVHKLYTKRKNYLVHDEGELCKEGDSVRIQLCRPISARKRFAVAEIFKKAPCFENLTIDKKE